MNALKVIWKWLDGRKANWGSWCMFASIFATEFVIGVWEYDPSWMDKAIQSLNYFAITVFGVGKIHKQTKLKQANGAKMQVP